MNPFKLLIAMIIAGSGFLSACKKTYICACAGGFVFRTYNKEIKAQNEQRARKKCEENNPPPNSPDAIYCQLK